MILTGFVLGSFWGLLGGVGLTFRRPAGQIWSKSVAGAGQQEDTRAKLCGLELGRVCFD